MSRERSCRDAGPVFFFRTPQFYRLPMTSKGFWSPQNEQNKLDHLTKHAESIFPASFPMPCSSAGVYATPTNTRPGTKVNSLTTNLTSPTRAKRRAKCHRRITADSYLLLQYRLKYKLAREISNSQENSSDHAVTVLVDIHIDHCLFGNLTKVRPLTTLLHRGSIKRSRGQNFRKNYLVNWRSAILGWFRYAPYKSRPWLV